MSGSPRTTQPAGGGSGDPVVVIGASLSGLFAAAAAAEAGRPVTVVERDVLDAGSAARPGVPQGRQNHVLLHRGLLAAEELVPGLESALEAAGAVRVDTGTLPWYGPYGWQPTSVPSFDVLSVTRPRLEQLVRERVLARPGVRLVEGARVSGLAREASAWVVTCADGRELKAAVVVDASGRGSRMPHWLSGLGRPVAEPEVVDAGLGYACRLYRQRPGRPRVGVVVAATPQQPCSGIGLPVEDDLWMVSAAGYGPSRPGRDREGFLPYLASLRDPVLAEVTTGLEPVGGVSVHRQTANRRHRYGSEAGWPDGLLVVGDALCAFNPIYGQGITVGACQALVLREALSRARPEPTRAVQRRLSRVADLPWSIATGEDQRYLPGHQPTPGQRLVSAWTTELGLLAMTGHRRALWTFGAVYHLMASPLQLLHPALVAAVARRRITGQDALPPRPAVLDRLVDELVR